MADTATVAAMVEQLYIERHRRRLRLREVADRMGVSGAALSAWERHVSAPRAQHLIAWAHALDRQLILRTHYGPMAVTSLPDLTALLVSERKAQGLLQREVAAASGLRQSQICEWESGNRPPTAPSLIRWLAAFNWHLDLPARDP
ncbi:helix-turn-helix transcriptional regulator [Thermoactinospora rubra]|uniref:helix-turn-helix transcriptional regulator n=1 Tax=Thermoactinospora rubra TaxID=1088767 RepID=UPI001301E9FC|nr:helix-turn-helix transcriptional regulator [Thermoactinospora rubra]